MYRNNYSNQKPEYALKRVNDLIASAIGNNADKEKKFALEQLHNIVSGAKRKQWQKVYEPIMKKHLELCVELKDHRTAKDGLHQYRNMCQNVDPSSLENVILHLMELAESRATQARDRANKVALAAAAKISDLDQEETPESIMLSTMTEEGAKDRTDREVVVPWLKFLWEIYRAILELLHKNAKLERVYHKTCEKAFKFCLDYQRALEFRRLCEMLRQHLANLQRIIVQPKTARVVWEWTPEAIELHLQTRFSQLEVATSLELWNEGFRTVEDIYAIMQLGKKTPKPRLMAAYYEKLTRIFWVSDNYLFHAYTWYRYHSLSCECKKDMKPDERVLQASNTLLAALCIPSIKDTVNALEDDDMALEKNQQMAMLLDFQSNPTRQALLVEMVGKGLLTDVLPELASLYDLLETKFTPLTLVKQLLPILKVIKAHPQLTCYTLPLQRIIVLRLIQQLSKVYTAVKMDFIKSLLVGLDLSYFEVEKIIIDGVARKQLSLRLDHSTGCVRFGASVSMGPALESKMLDISSKLNIVAAALEKTVHATKKDEISSKRRVYLELVASEVDDISTVALERKMIIERRKEGLERLQIEKQKEEEKRKEIEEAKRREEESHRLAREETQRNEAKMKQMNDKIQRAKIKSAFLAIGKPIDENTLVELDEAALRQLLAEAQSEATRAKGEEQKKLLDEAKRLDHITRALRIESSKLYEKKYEEQQERDLHDYEETIRIKQLTDREEHAKALEEKVRMLKMHSCRSAFESDLLAQQRVAYEKRVIAMREDAIREYKQRKIAQARRRKIEHDERLEELEQERAEKEAADRLLAEEFERLRRDKELEAEAALIKEALREQARKEAEVLEAARAEAAAKRQKEEEAAEAESGWHKQETKPKARRNFDDRVEESSRSGGGGFGGSKGPSRDSERRIDAPVDGNEWARVKAPEPRDGPRDGPPPRMGGGGGDREQQENEDDGGNTWRRRTVKDAPPANTTTTAAAASPSAPWRPSRPQGGGGGGGDRDRERDSMDSSRQQPDSTWRSSPGERGGGGGGGDNRPRRDDGGNWGREGGGRRDDKPRTSGGPPPDEASSWRKK
eukprot:gene7659-15674_t